MKDEAASGCACIVVGIVGALIGLFIGENYSSQRQAEALRADAIRAHVAEYYLDQNNERKFRWKECK